MATQRELIQTVKNILRGGIQSDDEAISDRQVAFLIDAARATLLRQQYNKGQNLSENNIQTITCLAMETADASLIPSLPSGCTFYKSTLPLPSFIESKGKDLITGISGPLIGAITYELIPYARVPYATFTKFKRTIATTFNNHLILINSDFTLTVAVSGVYEQPGALTSYNDCAGTPCFTWDSNYPMSAHLIDTVTKIVLQNLLNTPQMPQDRTNSGAHELESQVNNNISGQYAAAQTSKKR